MNITNTIRKLIMKTSGYWIYKKNQLPTGTDLFEDINNKLKIKIKIIFDIGANIGSTCQWFRNEFKYADIYAFEPISSTFNVLKQNLKGKNIICEKLALGNKEELVTIKLHPKELSNLNSLDKKSMNPSLNAEKEDIQVTTLDRYLDEHKIPEIDLLKIDSEGFEINILTGGRQLLNSKKVKLIYCEVGFNDMNERNTSFTELLEYLNKKGYFFYALYELNHREIQKGFHFGNALFINSNYCQD